MNLSACNSELDNYNLDNAPSAYPACRLPRWTHSTLCTAEQNTTSSMEAGFGRHGMPPPVCNPDFWPFDLETGVQVASKVGNLHSKFGHARPLGSRIIRYVCDGRTDRQTDGRNQRLLPLPYGRGHSNRPSCVDCNILTTRAVRAKSLAKVLCLQSTQRYRIAMSVFSRVNIIICEPFRMSMSSSRNISRNTILSTAWTSSKMAAFRCNEACRWLVIIWCPGCSS